MTLCLIYSFDTQYRPAPGEYAVARADVLRLLAGLPTSPSFFALAAKARKSGMHDDLFDYVFRELRRDKTVKLNDDHTLEVSETVLAGAI